jgi:hypothetical protein
MVDASERGRTIHMGAEMRPRRWYTDERAPPSRVARMTSELWRYRSLAQRRKYGAAPVAGAASSFCDNTAFPMKTIVMLNEVKHLTGVSQS